MTTIHIVLAEKQYSSSKVLAAFDDAEAAGKFVETVNAVEPRYVLSVQPIELQRAPPKPFTIRSGEPSMNVAFERAPDLHWVSGQFKGAPMVGDDPPELFIPLAAPDPTTDAA